MSDLIDCSVVLLKAFMKAHEKILIGGEESEAGTTTLIGGIIAPLKKEKIVDNHLFRWSFTTACVGDCTAIRYSWRDSEFKVITNKGRLSNDVRDCGGRLGPSRGDGAPDLRNLALFSCLMEEGDIVISLSDGIFDNLDPEFLGMSPSELGIDLPSWEDAEAQNVQAVRDLKTSFAEELMKEIVSRSREKRPKDSPPIDPTSPFSTSEITKALVNHSRSITSKTRSYMEANPGVRQPR